MMLFPEHVIWQSPDYTWNVGVYRAYQYSEDDQIPDEVLDEFVFVSGNHATPEEAEDAWKGAHNDDGVIIEYGEHSYETVNHLDSLKHEFFVNKNNVYSM